jgi:ribonuclease HII
LCRAIRDCALVGVGIATVAEIDSINIYHATMLAMARAVDALVAVAGCDPRMVLVDGNALPKWRYPATAVVGGDARCLSIAAASIVAKHERDRMMLDYDRAHPGYGWARNKGYGTAAHLTALGTLGPSPIHRRSFAPVRACVREAGAVGTG